MFNLTEFRTIIKYLYWKGLTPLTALEELQSIFNDESPSRTMVYKYYQRFKFGNYSVEDDVRCGRPLMEDITEKIQLEIKKDPYFSSRSVAAILKVDHKTVSKILKAELNMVKVNVKWVPKILTDEQKIMRVEACKVMLRAIDAMENLDNLYTQDETWISYENPRRSMWLLAGSTPPVGCKRGIGTKKIMISVIMSTAGIFSIDALPRGQSFNKEFYLGSVIKPFCKRIGKSRRQVQNKKVVIHMDNARPHLVNEELDKLGVVRLIHPPYSPDLAPCDFFLFGYLKMKLEGSRFKNDQEVINAVNEILKSIDRITLASVHLEWVRRLELCISMKGEFVN